MPGKYRVHAELELSSEVEPEGHLIGIDDDESVLDYEDHSSWDRVPVTVSGGEVVIEVEGENEDDALDVANAALDNASFSGDGYFEWEIADYRITGIEEITPPMDLERAVALIRAYLDREVVENRMERETLEAFVFVLDKITP